MTIYGQAVIGPPGSGKTTYCNGMQQYLRLIGRNCWVVNLDPANEHPEPNNQTPEHLPYETILDVCVDVVNLSSVMEKLVLGPNGGLLYCMEYIEKNLPSLLSLLKSRISDPKYQHDTSSPQQPPYLLFDLPGQVELYTHCDCVRGILHGIVKEFDCRLSGVQLLDSHFCHGRAERYISGALWCVSSMIRLELPTVNILSKIDLIAAGTNRGDGNSEEEEDNGGEALEEDMPFRLEFFTECTDLVRLAPYLDPDGRPLDSTFGMAEDVDMYWNDEEYRRVRTERKNSAFHKKYRKMHTSLCELLDDYSLVNFLTLNINEADSVGRVVARIDKANGFVFLAEVASREQEYSNLFQCAVANDEESSFERLAEVEERYMNAYKDFIPELATKGVRGSATGSGTVVEVDEE